MQAIRAMDARIPALIIRAKGRFEDSPNSVNDESILSKLRETMIRKSREHCTSFLKYSGDSKQRQALRANICYYVIDYKVETIVAEDVKFTIYRSIETNRRTRVLHCTWNLKQ